MCLNELNKNLSKIFDELILSFIFCLNPIIFLCFFWDIKSLSFISFLVLILLSILPQQITLIYIVKAEISLEGGQIGERNYQKDIKRRNHLIELNEIFT